jgi:transposase InsO family protein
MKASNYLERKTAIHLIRSGISANEVAVTLGRSPSWVYKWWDRHKERGWDGLHDQSRAPKNHPNELPKRVKQEIRKARSELEAEAKEPGKLVYIGAPAIKARLRKRMIRPLPSIGSIERELRNAGMTNPCEKEEPPKLKYPHLQPTRARYLVQVDIFPHYLPGGDSTACFNAIDVVSRYPAGMQSSTKRSKDAVQALLHVWRELGLPDYTQVDNESCFSGGFTHPYVLGKVLRLALLVGTELVFSPVYHPESNGTVERFHQDYDCNVWKKIELPDLKAVKDYSPIFYNAYRKSHHHSALKGKSPADIHLARPLHRLPTSFKAPAKLPLTAGKVHFMRRVNQDRKVRILNVDWDISQANPDQGVWATLDIWPHTAKLHFFDAAPDAIRRRLLASHPFPIKDPVVPLQPQFQRPFRIHSRSWLSTSFRLVAGWLSTML